VPPERLGTSLELRGLSKYYDNVAAVADVSLSVQPGEFVTLLGPSGSGKTTTLNLVAGLTAPTTGEILVDGRDISKIPPHQRDIGVVFQGYLLFPHLTVFKNIAYPLARRKVPVAERKRRVMEALELVHLERMADRYPRQLSGGEQQRVALARAIVFRPPVLLMDEPMGALDRKLRESLQWELKRIQQETKVTCLYVTHDQEEALILSDRIAIFHDGRIEQVGPAGDLYERPVSLFVARFVGESNCFTGRVDGSGGGHGEVVVTGEGFSLRAAAGQAGPSGTATILVRPERMRAVAPGTELADNTIRGQVRSITYLGPALRVEVGVPGLADLVVREPTHLGSGLRAGDPVDVIWRAADGWLIPGDEPAGNGAPSEKEGLLT
jgi:putative spermidine/putrescine transport system ATP-binding protein